MVTLEEKIKKAKELGIKFNLIPFGSNDYGAPYDTLSVQQNWTDEQFEKALDQVISKVEATTFYSLLKKYDLISSK